MTTRPDLTDKLVHFTKGADTESAYETLVKIIGERVLLGGNTAIRRGYRCVCFTEAPLPALREGLDDAFSSGRYAPFGILIQKTWLFEHGGRPVIYQTDEEFLRLPEDLRWRHVRYEPPHIDFTWEREWRLRSDGLALEPASAALVVPNRDWAERLVAEHEQEDGFKVRQYAQIMDEDLARMYRRGFPWRIVVLSDDTDDDADEEMD